MKNPKIYFHQSFYEYFKECTEMGIDFDITTVKGWVTKFTIEAWEKLIKKFDIDLTKRFDIAIRTYNSEIMPLVTNEGVVIRLDLGREEIDYKDKENIRSIIFHEVYHLADRLDPKFKMDYHLDAEIKQRKLRRVINAVWDLYIESRKFYVNKIMPIYCKDRESNYQDETRIEEESRKSFLNKTDSLGIEVEISKEIFNKIWNKHTHLTYSQVYGYSKKICPKDECSKDKCC